MMASCPCLRSTRATWLPMYPAPPMTRTFMLSMNLSAFRFTGGARSIWEGRRFRESRSGSPHFEFSLQSTTYRTFVESSGRETPCGDSMPDSLLIAKSKNDLTLLPGMANRHGLVAGATGTGKTVTLQVMAENFSRIGVPVFAADVKAALSGISQPGKDNPKLADRVKKLQLSDFSFAGSPAACWDVFGEEGHPVRATVSEMGPLLFSRLLNLNDTQSGVLTLVFKIADDNGLLLLDLKDLQAMLQDVGDNATQFTTEYGNISAASIGAIQRGLLAIDQQGADNFFGEPALDLAGMMQTDTEGRGVINILTADK